jgi:hypothetical protein
MVSGLQRLELARRIPTLASDPSGCQELEPARRSDSLVSPQALQNRAVLTLEVS